MYPADLRSLGDDDRIASTGLRDRVPTPIANHSLLQRFRGGAMVLAAMLLTVVCVAVGGAAIVTVLPRLDLVQPHARGASRLGDSVQWAAARALPSIVEIETVVGPASSSGSGIILSADGFILTNAHVLAEPLGIWEKLGPPMTFVTFADAHTAPFTVIGSDPLSDIAVIRVEGVSHLTPVEIGSSGDLVVGQKVVAIGAPLGLAGTVTTGIVSALHRPVVSSGQTPDDRTVIDAIQTDAAINPGNSGGALVDITGALVGLNSASATTGADYVNAPGSIGLGFAIPVEQALRIADELIATGKATHATLGVEVVTDTPPRGAKIVGLDPNGPGAAAGLSVGSLITRLDDRVISTADDLLATLQSKVPGDLLALTYAAPSGLVETVHVTLGVD